jgi:hypothetical protein
LVKEQEDEEFVKRLELLQQQLKLYNGWQEVRSLLMRLTTLRPLVNLADFRTGENLCTYQSQEYYATVEAARTELKYNRGLSPEIKEVCVEVTRNERDIVYLAPTGTHFCICIMFHYAHVPANL